MGSALEEAEALFGAAPTKRSALEEAEALEAAPAPKKSWWQRLAGRVDAQPASRAAALNATPKLSGERMATTYNAATNMMTLGVADKIRNAIGDSSTPEERARLARENPGDDMTGKALGLVGSMVAGPARVLDTAARAGMSRLAPGLAASVPGRIAAGAGAGAAAGAAGGAVEGGWEGAKTGAKWGAAAGAGGQALAEGGRAAAAGLMRLPWIRRFVEASDDGRIAAVEADMAAGRVAPGREGIQQVKERTRDEIQGRRRQLADEAGSRYQAAIEPELGRPMNMTPVRRQVLETGVNSRPLSAANVEASTPVVDRGKRVLDDLQSDPTVEDALQVRRQLDESAGFGSPSPTPDQLAARNVRGGVRQGIREASPAVAQADDAFSAHKARQHRADDIVYRNEEGGRMADAAPTPADEALEGLPVMRAGDESRAATNLGRIGDTSEEGLRFQSQLQELADMDPEFGAALQRMLAKKAFEATRFSLDPAIQDNLAKSTALGGWWRLLGQQGNALGARAGLPAAAAAEGAGRAVRQSAPLFGAIGAGMQADEKRKKR